MNPTSADETFRRALSAMQAGDAAAAERLFRRVLQSKPRHTGALNLLSILLAGLGRFAEAERYVQLAAQSGAPSDVTLYNYGLILKALKRPDEALQKFTEAIRINPLAAEAWSGRGAVLSELKRYAEAVADFDRAIAIRPESADAFFNQGNALAELRRYDEALDAYGRALGLRPDDFAEAWLGRSRALAALCRYDDALAACNKALLIKPEFAEGWLGKGNVLYDLKQYGDALAAYNRALELNDHQAYAWHGRGNVFADTGRHEEALAAFDQALAIQPDLNYAPGARILAKLMICEWANLKVEIDHLRAAVSMPGALPSAPFPVLAMPSSPAEQLQCARSNVEAQPRFAPVPASAHCNHARLRIAYLSGDFRDHATATLLAGLFERHDRSRFEVTGISFGPDDKSAMRGRLELAFEHFADFQHKSDTEIADFIRQNEIDIAIDLMGFTRNCRPGVLGRRPAPIQVSYLGYIGTMGADYIDYIIADEIALPYDHQKFFTEKIIHLPGCFLVTDDTVEIAPHTPSRQEAGLPEDGFIFCSFNSSYKFNRPVFESWMRLLDAVAGSVLWLAQSNARMAVNLRREAARCGVAPERIIFAPRLALAHHLARQRLAGLFLDTSPYNAGATGVAALWSGVPLVTMAGNSFVGRMAASMLPAVGLNELVTDDAEEYEALALKLAQDSKLLSAVRQRLQDNIRTTPLFDTDRFRRHLEQAYTVMVDIHRRGEGPRSFSVEPA